MRQAVRDELNDDVGLYTRLASEAEARGENTLAEHFRAIKAQEERHHATFEQAVEKAFKAN
nr:ferritin family protein [Rhodoblastus sphagnicola]